MAVRTTNRIETRMISDYVVQNYANFPHYLGVPLGKVEPALAASVGIAKAIKMSRPYRDEVDALVILPNYLVLIEAKVWNINLGLGKLPGYKSLVPFTPELQKYLPRDIIMELVIGWSNPNIEIKARDMGIVIKVFTPDYVQEAANKMNLYWTAEYRAAREQKLALRQYFGIE